MDKLVHGCSSTITKTFNAVVVTALVQKKYCSCSGIINNQDAWVSHMNNETFNAVAGAVILSTKRHHSYLSSMDEWYIVPQAGLMKHSMQ
jgi:hypothetical protein